MDIKRYGFKTEDYSVYMSEFKNGKYYKVSEAKGIIEDNKLMIDTLEVQEAEIKKLREALDRIRPWISRITDGILADWQEDLCWDIDLICAEAIRSRGEE